MLSHSTERIIMYTYEASYQSDLANMPAGLWLFCLVFAILQIIGMWKIFEKAGEPGWKSLIPFYSQYTMYKVFWGEGWLFLLLLVPLINIIVTIMFSWKMALSFGRGIGTCIGLILVPGIMTLVLGFGSAQYYGAPDR